MPKKEGLSEQLVTLDDPEWNPSAPRGEGVPRTVKRAVHTVPAHVRDAVGTIRTSQGEDGTATRTVFRTPQGMVPCVVTCLHVIPTKGSARRGTFGSEEELEPDRLFVTFRAHDLVVCALKGNATDKAWLCPRHWRKTWGSNNISILHHPNASALSLTKGLVASHTMECFIHTANTLPGSSGGCVLIQAGDEWNWVGVHCEAITLNMGKSRVMPLNVGCTLGLVIDELHKDGIDCAVKRPPRRA